jgi:hypothetical protein
MDKDKLKFISANEVPYTRQTKWDEIFAQIPKGQALVLEEPEVNADTLRAALLRRKRQGKFKNLQMIARGKRGHRKSYVANADKK